MPASFAELRAVRHTLELYRQACPGKVALLLLSIYIFCQARRPSHLPQLVWLSSQLQQAVSLFLAGAPVMTVCHAKCAHLAAPQKACLIKFQGTLFPQTCAGLTECVLNTTAGKHAGALCGQ